MEPLMLRLPGVLRESKYFYLYVVLKTLAVISLLLLTGDPDVVVIYGGF